MILHGSGYTNNANLAHFMLKFITFYLIVKTGDYRHTLELVTRFIHDESLDYISGKPLKNVGKKRKLFRGSVNE